MAIGKEKRKRTPEHHGVDGRETQAEAGAGAAEAGRGSVGGGSGAACTSKRSKNSEVKAVACEVEAMGDQRGTTEAKMDEAEGGRSKSTDKNEVKNQQQTSKSENKNKSKSKSTTSTKTKKKKKKSEGPKRRSFHHFTRFDYL